MEKDTIIFDAECNLCNGVIGWLLKFAPANLFEFIPFQSPKGQHLLKQCVLPKKELTTVILLDKNGAHTHSDGFLEIIRKLPNWQLVAALLALIPKMIRDTVYNIASRNRVKWFGRSDACTVSF